jgi:hypothetical protein
VSADEIGTELVRYDAMCRAIAEAYEVDEVKDIRDKAMAIALYAKQANNHEAELQAIQIRVRAERKAGELLKEIPTAQGQRTDLVPPRDEVLAPKQKVLSDLNISKQGAAEWERLADVPADEFETHLATSDAPSARSIVYDHVRLHGSEPADRGRTLTADDFANAYLEGAIKDIQRLENIYDNVALVKDALANARRTIAAHLIPKPPQKGSGIRVVK